MHRGYRGVIEREETGMGQAMSDVEALLPLTPAVFHILLALAGGERHGYAIMREVSELTGGALKLGPGTLYRSINALLGQGLIAEVEERPDPALDDERRRYYRLTELGERAAQAEAARLAALVDVARARRLLPGKPGAEPALGGAR
jgi:DNA-binding PadR family transcriptional regulator